MSARGPLVRSSLGLVLLLAGALALIGGVAVRGAGLLAVLLAAVVAGAVAAGIARESAPVRPRQAALDAAWRVGAWTVGVLLVLCGAQAVAGGGAVLLVGLGTAGALGAGALARRVRAARARAAAQVLPFPAEGPAARSAGAGWAAGLSVEELGRAWVRSSAALAGTRDPVARERLVVRRQQALDELERRDPAGFARWLAAGATIDSDPARWVCPPASGTEAA